MYQKIPVVLDKCLSTSPLKNRGEKQKPTGWTAKKSGKGKGKGMGFRVGWSCFRARARVWSWGVQVWGFRSKGSGKRFSRKWVRV